MDYCGAAHQLSGHQENTRVKDLAQRQSLLLQRCPACSASCSPEPRAALAAWAERQEPLGRLIRLGRRWSSESWSTCSCSSASSNNAADQVHPCLPLCGHLKRLSEGWSRAGCWICSSLTLTKPDEALSLSPYSFWSGLSGRAVGPAFILLAPLERVKPLMERGRDGGRLASLLVCSCQSCAPLLYQLPANFRI